MNRAAPHSDLLPKEKEKVSIRFVYVFIVVACPVSCWFAETDADSCPFAGRNQFNS